MSEQKTPQPVITNKEAATESAAPSLNESISRLQESIHPTPTQERVPAQQYAAKTVVKVVDSRIPHCKKIVLTPDQRLTECVVMKETPTEMYVIPTNHLDRIDLKRIHSIVTSVQARSADLPTVMGTHYMANGVLALNYFHQKVIRVCLLSGRVTPVGPTY